MMFQNILPKEENKKQDIDFSLWKFDNILNMEEVYR